MRSVISIAPLVICIITAVMTRKDAAPLTESNAKALKIANIVGFCLSVLSAIWALIGGVISIIAMFASLSAAARYGGAEYMGFSGLTIVLAIASIVISIAVSLAIAYWHYYLLEKKLGGFKQAFNMNSNSAPAQSNPVVPPVVDVKAEEVQETVENTATEVQQTVEEAAKEVQETVEETANEVTNDITE